MRVRNQSQVEKEDAVIVSYLESKFYLDLKLVSAIFYQFFIFSPDESPSKTMKNVFCFI